MFLYTETLIFTDKQEHVHLVQGFIPDGCPEACAFQGSGESLQVFLTLLENLKRVKMGKILELVTQKSLKDAAVITSSYVSLYTYRSFYKNL